jgi:hypothetical protein
MTDDAQKRFRDSRLHTPLNAKPAQGFSLEHEPIED